MARKKATRHRELRGRDEHVALGVALAEATLADGEEPQEFGGDPLRHEYLLHLGQQRLTEAQAYADKDGNVLNTSEEILLTENPRHAALIGLGTRMTVEGDHIPYGSTTGFDPSAYTSFEVRVGAPCRNEPRGREHWPGRENYADANLDKINERARAVARDAREEGIPVKIAVAAKRGTPGFF